MPARRPIASTRFVRALGEDIGPPARIDRLHREAAELLSRGASFVIARTDTPLSGGSPARLRPR